jgi:hypothetical protein
MFKLTKYQLEFLNTMRDWAAELTSDTPLGETCFKDFIHIHKFILGENEEYDDNDKIVFNRLREIYIKNN